MDHDIGIIGNMWACAGDYSIVKRGFEFILNKADGDFGVAAQMKRKQLVDQGAAIAVIEGMKHHAERVDIQILGCNIMRFLARNEENILQMMGQGAGETVISTMNNNFGSEAIQRHGLGALQNLSKNAEYKICLMKIGCCQTVINALHAHLRNDEVQVSGHKTLELLLSSNESIIEALGQDVDRKLVDLIRIINQTN